MQPSRKTTRTTTSTITKSSRRCLSVFHLYYYYALLLLLLVNQVESQNLKPNALNHLFDPDHHDEDQNDDGLGSRRQSNLGSFQNCSIPPFQDTEQYQKPSEGQCGSSVSLASLTEAELQLVAEAYAPVLFFHPLDDFTLADPAASFKDPSGGKLYRRLYDDVGRDPDPIEIEDSLNLTTMLLLSKPNINDGNDIFFEQNNPGRAGAGFTTDSKDAKRRLSRAPIYYNIFETDVGGTWVINYWFYYDWNGAQTTGFGVGRGQHSVVETAPYGSHEGDWESMSVLICSTAPEEFLLEPIAVTYQAHGFAQITDCTIGDCIFFQDTNHPVGFVALNSHATYPVSSRNHVYALFGINVLYFLPGFAFLADQTVWRNEETGVYKMWHPNATNILKHADPKDVTPVNSSFEDYWQGFGGRWGEVRDTGIPPPERPPKCMNTIQNEYVECPAIPLITNILRLLGSGAIAALGCIFSAVGELPKTQGPLGAGRKRFFSEYLPPEAASLWAIQPRLVTTEDNFCQWLGVPVTADGANRFQPGIASFWLSAAVGTTSFVSNIGRFAVALFWRE